MSTELSTRLKITAKAKKAEVLIYDEIGVGFFSDGITAKEFADTLKGFGEINQIDVRINSVGGDVYDGMAIYNILNNHAAHVTVFVDSVAASIASVIAMSGDQIVMAENAMLMIHNPFGLVLGDADDMRAEANALDKFKDSLAGIYVSRSKQDSKQVARWMDEEKWFSADEAIDAGFATEKSANKAIAASGRLKVGDVKPRFKNIPEAAKQLFNTSTKEPIMAAETTPAVVTETTTPIVTPIVKPEEETKTTTTTVSETKPLDSGVQASIDTAIRNERKRIADVQAMCDMARLPENSRKDLANRLVNGGATVQEAQGELFNAMCKANPPIGEGGSGDTQATTAPDADAKYKKEYAAQKAAYERHGLTEAEYVDSRKIDEGIIQLRPKAAA